jgi:hypothetical protein
MQEAMTLRADAVPEERRAQHAAAVDAPRSGQNSTNDNVGFVASLRSRPTRLLRWPRPR